MPALLNEEQLVIKYLSQYGPLPYRQALLLTGKPLPTAKKIIRNLRDWAYLYDLENRYLSVDPTAMVDQKMVRAVWILLQYRQDVEPLNHHPAAYPAKLFFLKGQTGYAVVVLERGEEHLLRLIEPEEDTKYIIVVEDAGMLQVLRPPNAPCLFAVVADNGDEEPHITFYGGSSHGSYHAI